MDRVVGFGKPRRRAVSAAVGLALLLLLTALTISVRDWYLAGVGRVATAFGDPLTGAPDEWLVSARIDDIVLPPSEAP